MGQLWQVDLEHRMREEFVWDGKKLSDMEANFEFFQLLGVLRQENVDSCTISGSQAGNRVQYR